MEKQEPTQGSNDQELAEQILAYKKMEYYIPMTDDKHESMSTVATWDYTRLFNVKLVNIDIHRLGCVQGLQLCKNHAEIELRVGRGYRAL